MSRLHSVVSLNPTQSGSFVFGESCFVLVGPLLRDLAIPALLLSLWLTDLTFMGIQHNRKYSFSGCKVILIAQKY